MIRRTLFVMSAWCEQHSRMLVINPSISPSSSRPRSCGVPMGGGDEVTLDGVTGGVNGCGELVG